MNQAATEDHELRSMYSDLQNERQFEVRVLGPQGGEKIRRLRLHPLARAIPQMSVQEFLDLGQTVKEKGVRVPIVLYNGQVLDGRHRVAIAAALRVPVRVEEFTGDDTDALDEVMFLNLHRRHLSIAQRALIVGERYLPQAKAEVKVGRPEGTNKLPPTGGNFQRDDNAIQIAAKRSNGLASARTLQRMEPVWEAPKTRERIRSGEITNATDARRAALKELGKDAPGDVPGTPKPFNTDIGQSLGSIRRAVESLQKGHIGEINDVLHEEIKERLAEIIATVEEAIQLVDRYSSDARND